MRRLVTFLLALALLFGMLPGALAAEEDGPGSGVGQEKERIVTVTAEQAMRSVIVVCTYGADGRMVSGQAMPDVDLQPGENAIPVSVPSGGAYSRVYFLDSEMRPFHDAVDPDSQDPEDPPEASGFRYGRTLLTTPEERKAYDRIAEGLLARKSVIEGLPPDLELLYRTIPLILQDYPECFWYFGGGTFSVRSVGNAPVEYSYNPTYLYTETEQAELQSRIDAWVKECFAGIPDDASDYDKALYVYRYVIDHSDYRVETDNSIVSIIVNGYGICGSYAKTIQYLLNLLGIDATLIAGKVQDDSGEVVDHGWNLVWLDGTPCWIDATWGDPVMEEGVSNGGPDYTFFGLTSKDISRSHTPSQDVPVPGCVSEEYNYFRRSGLYFETYDEEKLVEVMSNALSAGETRICLRFSDGVWDEAGRRLLTDRELGQLLGQAISRSGLNSGFSYNYLLRPSYGSLSVTVTLF